MDRVRGREVSIKTKPTVEQIGCLVRSFTSSKRLTRDPLLYLPDPDPNPKDKTVIERSLPRTRYITVSQPVEHLCQRAEQSGPFLRHSSSMDQRLVLPPIYVLGITGPIEQWQAFPIPEGSFNSSRR